MNSYSQNKLYWKCRRGLLELDLVLQRFLPQVEDGEVESLVRILDMPDNDLWDIVIGRSNDFDPHFNDIVARLRAA